MPEKSSPGSFHGSSLGNSPRNSLSPLELIISGEERRLSPSLRKDFAYLLGIFQLNHGHARRWEISFSRMINDEKVLLNLKGIAKRLGTRKPRINGRRFQIYDRRLMEALLSGVEEKFYLLVANDSERVAFLQGYFDHSKAKARWINHCSVEYRTSCLNPGGRKKLLETFLELGIYPSPRGNYISINHFANLHRLYSLVLDQDEENRRVVKKFLDKYKGKDSSVIQNYYAIRKASRKLFEKGEKFSLAQTGSKKGVSRAHIYLWTADISKEYGRKFVRYEKPSIAACYEKLLEELQLPNIYLIEEPARRKEKIFIPANDDYVYCLSPEAQADYLAVLENAALEKEPAGLDNEDLRYLQSQLELNLSGSENKELDVSFDEARTIKSIKKQQKAGKLARKSMFQEVCLIIKRENGAEEQEGQKGQERQRYFLPPKLQEKYFKLYEVKPEPFKEEHREHLQGELSAFLNRERSRDLNFKLSGRTIKAIYLK